MSVIIKKCDSDSLGELYNLANKTFQETYEGQIEKEDIQNYIESNFSKDRLKQELGASESLFYLVFVDNKAVGYMKLNFGNTQTDLKNKERLEIERIYILKEFQGRKIGRRLLSQTINLAKEMKINFIWLGVWEKNLKAIRFYERNSFIKFDTHIFKIGNKRQTDILMRLKLKNSA